MEQIMQQARAAEAQVIPEVGERVGASTSVAIATASSGGVARFQRLPNIMQNVSGGGFSLVNWEARFGTQEAYQLADAGCGIVYLELPRSDCDLQELISAWYYQAHTHALILEQDLLLLQLLDDFLIEASRRCRSGFDSQFEYECLWKGARGLRPVGPGAFGFETNGDSHGKKDEELRVWNAFKQTPPTETTGAETDALDKDCPSKTTDLGKGQNSQSSGNGNGGQQLGKKGDFQTPWRGGQWGRQRNQWGQWPQDGTEGADVEALKALLNQVARLCLRHEDSTNLWRAESSDVLFIRTRIPGSLVPALFSAKTEWQALKQESPDKVHRTVAHYLDGQFLSHSIAAKAYSTDTVHGWRHIVRIHRRYDSFVRFQREAVLQALEDEEDWNLKHPP
ncbi:unnamed protein product [Symbiodinium sp. CCMP2592]|nr:unnamed protein product [Symbiodinium sp. CCMP2592]